MSENCAVHGLYLSVLADGELELVPATTRQHVLQCADCARELSAYRVLNLKLRDALPMATPATGTRRLRRGPHRLWTRLTIGGMAAALLVGGGVGFSAWRSSQEPPGLSAAMAAATAPAQFSSSSTSAIHAWCVQSSGRPMPTLDLPGLTPVGARMDRADGVEVITLSYVTPIGERVGVSWLDSLGSAPRSTSVESRVVSGRMVLMLHSTAGAAVVSGDASASVLWAAAGAIEARGG
ncbi:MAG: hypothetical protein NVS3B24_21970 [Candidatus Dormibacteria bacterium]